MGRNWHIINADARAIPLADGSVDMVFESSPYADARTYNRALAGEDRSCKHRAGPPLPGRHWQYRTCLRCGRLLEHLAGQRNAQAWVDWMLDVVAEGTRVSRGLVLLNCAGVTRKRCYWPCPEGLMWEWFKRGGSVWRPVFWHRVGVPGSGGHQWLRSDVEYVLAFKRDREWLPWSDNTANGHPPKWGPGGEMSYRLSSGARVNQWEKLGSGKGMGARKPDGSYGNYQRPSHTVLTLEKWQTPWGNRPPRAGKGASGEPNGNYFNGNGFVRSHTKREPGGEMREQTYVPPVLANPGTLVRVDVGGGKMGSSLAHENEAPFPVSLAEWFIRSWCPPGGTVLDRFSGSGTTVDAAQRLGRIGIGMDLRFSQCQLGTRRILASIANPAMRPNVRRRPRAKGQMRLFGEHEAA